MGEAEASASPNTTPTEAPFSQWEAWVSDTDETKVTNDAEIVTSGADGTSSTQNNIEDDASHKEEEKDKEDTAISGFNPDGWALENWQSRENVEHNADDLFLRSNDLCDCCNSVLMCCIHKFRTRGV